MNSIKAILGFLLKRHLTQVISNDLPKVLQILKMDAGADECVKLWHVSTGQYLLEFPTLKRRPADFCRFTTDGRWLAYTVSNDSIRFVRLLDD